MRYVADTQTLVNDGVLTRDQADEIARRSRDDMVSLAINAVLFCGILTVIGGAAAFMGDVAQLTILGGVVTVGGGLALYFAPEQFRLLSNAAAVIGACLFVGGALGWIIRATESFDTATVLGALIALLFYYMWLRGSPRLRFLAGWMTVLGLGAHLTGLLADPAQVMPVWILYHYAGAAILACGVALNVRFVTALSMIAFASALSSATFYDSGVYSVAVYESTLMILQMAVFAGLGLWFSLRLAERQARHAGLMGQLSFIWMNMAFWVGSLWGDVVGYHLWAPRWSDFSAYSYRNGDEILKQSYDTAVQAFTDSATTISADAFALVWAVVILTAGLWAALTARREVFNAAMTFGAIHLYTQYFERLDATPGVIVFAGLLAIGLAYGAWSLNAWLKTRASQT